MKKPTLLLIALMSVLAVLPGAAQKKKGSLSILTYNMRISRPDLDDIRDYRSVARLVNSFGPHITALQNVDFVSGAGEGWDAISMFKIYAGMESGFTRNVAENESAYGVGILTVNNPLESWAIPLPGSFDPVALVHEYSDCIFISAQFPMDEESQMESVALLDSLAAIFVPTRKPLFVAGSFYFTPGSAPYMKMSENFGPLNDTSVMTYPASEPVICMDYIWAYTASGVNYRVTRQEIAEAPRPLSLHTPIFVIVEFEVPKEKRK